MEYTINGKTFSYSPQELKSLYDEFCAMDDFFFMQNLIRITHFACFVSFIKELNPIQTISDEGIVHRLIHLMGDEDPINDLKDIREQFETLLKF